MPFTVGGTTVAWLVGRHGQDSNLGFSGTKAHEPSHCVSRALLRMRGSSPGPFQASPPPSCLTATPFSQGTTQIPPKKGGQGGLLPPRTSLMQILYLSNFAHTPIPRIIFEKLGFLYPEEPPCTEI